jgi:hypothetical protein
VASADATELRGVAKAPGQALAAASAGLTSQPDPGAAAPPDERRAGPQMAAGHLAAVNRVEAQAESRRRDLPVVPAHKRVWADQPGAVGRVCHPEIRLALEEARSACRGALPEERSGAEHREPYRAEGFERRSAARADEDPKEPVPASASRSEWGAAERESDGRARKPELTRTRAVAVRNSVPEQPDVGEAARRKPDAALQPVDESALFL